MIAPRTRTRKRAADQEEATAAHQHPKRKLLRGDVAGWLATRQHPAVTIDFAKYMLQQGDVRVRSSSAATEADYRTLPHDVVTGGIMEFFPTVLLAADEEACCHLGL